MTQESTQTESQSTPVVRCSGKCGNYHESGYMVLHVPSTDQYYCWNCVMNTPDLREKYNELSGENHGARDMFTDPELNYAHRRRLTDRENRQLNDSWIRAHWRRIR